MSVDYLQHIVASNVPQSEPIIGRDMVKNSAGGFTFAVDDWTRLQRFLVLGAEGGTYYASERKLTALNAQAVLRCIKADGVETVQRIIAVSVQGRAPRQDPTLFALALAAAHGNDMTRTAVYDNLQQVCRTASHLFDFFRLCMELRGNGSGLHRAVAEWYSLRHPRDLAYQATKYQQRGGWSHRDILRLVRPKLAGDHQTIAHWITKGWPGVGEQPHDNPNMLPIWAMEKAKRAGTKEEIVRLVRDFALVRECIPTKWLNEPCVWEALLEKMPLTAMIRNLGKMTSIGLVAPLSDAARLICTRLEGEEHLHKARIHPIALLLALRVYAQGHGDKGSLQWAAVPEVMDALDGAFYLAFKAVEPTNKRFLLALDVSGSMGSGLIAGMPGVTPRVACAAMALITAAVEKQHHMVAFSSNGWSGSRVVERYRTSTAVAPVNISPKMRLDAVVSEMNKIPMGGTDCSLPMLYALHHKIPVDCFITYTDNETWAGGIHPCQALEFYREKMGIAARMVVVAFTATEATIADPLDASSMDVVGFDASAPAVIADFARGVQ